MNLSWLVTWPLQSIRKSMEKLRQLFTTLSAVACSALLKVLEAALLVHWKQGTNIKSLYYSIKWCSLITKDVTEIYLGYDTEFGHNEHWVDAIDRILFELLPNGTFNARHFGFLSTRDKVILDIKYKGSQGKTIPSNVEENDAWTSHQLLRS